MKDNKKIVGYELPTIQELLTTVNYELKCPATDLDYSIVKDWYHNNGENTDEYIWSCTPKCDTFLPCYWVIHFRNGRTTYVSDNSEIAVRFKIVYEDGSNGWTKVYSARKYDEVLKLQRELNSQKD